MSKEHLIKEGPMGTSHVPAPDIIPPDAKRLSFSTKSFEFYFHKNNGKRTLYIYVTNYHPGILVAPLEKLLQLVKYLKIA